MTGERGRPRNFDADDALEKALHVFWKRGFQDASLHDLTEAMGLSKPSLYAAFGDKEALYLKALERYIALLLERHAEVLRDESDPRAATEGFLRSMAAMLTDPALPGGCFIINGSADCGGSTIPAAVDGALRHALLGSEALIRERLQRAVNEGTLADSADELAAYFITTVAGMAVLAKSGATLPKLQSVITRAMAVWPPSPKKPRRP